MIYKKLILSLMAAAGIAAAAEEKDIAGRTYDKLTYDGKQSKVICRALATDEIRQQADKQLILCMIGDSVTWAEDGDHFRGELLKLIPELTFAGTHTAVLGYSHAGEGGDSSYRVLKRLNDKTRIPDAPYYHLLIGVNDASAAKTDAQSDKVASAAVQRIVKIVNGLLQRPATRKVFLASILPSPFDRKTGESTVRERTGSVINKKLRDDFKKLFPSGNVVWIEYEKPLRAELATWKLRKNLKGAHPTALGYKWIAASAAPVLNENMQPSPAAGKGKAGVQIVNLWDSKTASTPIMIPGWYTLSMELDKCSEVKFTLYSVTDKPKAQFKKTYTLKGKPGSRVELNFMTGYNGFGYTLAPFKLDVKAGAVKNIMIEKTRPLQKASRFGTGTFVDTASPIAPGEIVVREP